MTARILRYVPKCFENHAPCPPPSVSDRLSNHDSLGSIAITPLPSADLFPHLTVAQNVGFGLKARRMARARIVASVARALPLVRLGDLANRPINMFSGGPARRCRPCTGDVAAASAARCAFRALDRKLRERLADRSAPGCRPALPLGSVRIPRSSRCARSTASTKGQRSS